MNFDTGNIYHGFSLLKTQKIDDIDSEGYLFKHIKSGADLLYIQNEDENKVFSITFKTPPNDSSGIPHIMEHSVLCGSRKFPIKEPFVELLKGSMKTFLNAFTFPDKTMYPVASVNDKDFMNLMDVYLDAVFYPNAVINEVIFRQEGWHYKPDKEGNLKYNGVVYNEMLGAYSNPEQILMRKIKESLFPENQYGNESGGDPARIPDLDYDSFVHFHKTFYHPSNAKIIIYGNGEIEEHLSFLDREYLADFTEKNINSKIKKHSVIQNQKKAYYPILAGEESKGKSYLSINYVCGDALDAEQAFAMETLSDILMETQAAPLKIALLNAGIAKDVFSHYDSSILQPSLSFVLKHTEESKLKTFESILESVLRDLVKKGIDKNLIEAVINIREFNLREADFGAYPKGLIYSMNCLNGWLHDADPFEFLQFEQTLNKVKRALTEPYFEQLIQTQILDNSYRTVFILNPKKGLNEEINQENVTRLAEIKEKLSSESFKELTDNYSRLQKIQQTADSEEDIAKIPTLSLQDIQKKPRDLIIHKDTVLNKDLLYYPVFTNGIIYLKLLIPITYNSPADLQYLNLVSELLAKVDTSDYSYQNLSNEILIHTGGISFGVDSYSDSQKTDTFEPVFIVNIRVLTSKLNKALSLTDSILKRSLFKDKKRILELVREMKSAYDMSISSSGHVYAATRLSAYYSQKGMFQESLSGFEYYNFICSLEKELSDGGEAFLDKLEMSYSDMLTVRGMKMSLTCSKEDKSAVKNDLLPFLKGLPATEKTAKQTEFQLIKANEGFYYSGDVHYVAKGYNFLMMHHSYSGVLQVLRNIISLDYLWNQVRVQGGAYGAFASINRYGTLILSSYRDPNIEQTLDKYDGLVGYLEHFEATVKEMEKYIIGTFSQFDRPLSPAMQGNIAFSRYMSGISQEDIIKEREEMLSTTAESLRSAADLFRDVLGKEMFCVVGNETAMKDKTVLFSKLHEIFK